MNSGHHRSFLACICVWLLASVPAPAATGCRGVKATDSRSLGHFALPAASKCKPRLKDGLTLPDPNCTPGAVNRSLTVEVLTRKSFTTSCVRDKATSPAKKAATYSWYGLTKPQNNSGAAQICELDHLVSLQLGGADTLDNIWPQCGPSRAELRNRYFKQKDLVENWLADEVEAGRISLADAQRGIATDWTQYLRAAKDACQSKACKRERDYEPARHRSPVR